MGTSAQTEFRTPVVLNNLNPAWNYKGVLSDVSRQDSLIFEVMDKDWLPVGKPDNFIGNATLQVSKIQDSGGFDGELKLANTNSSSACLYVKVEVISAALA